MRLRLRWWQRRKSRAPGRPFWRRGESCHVLPFFLRFFLDDFCGVGLWKSLETDGHWPALSQGFLSISYGRFASYLFFRAGRTVVAGCLLIAGVQWLARTSSITDLILNAVALEAILQIDEMIFACLFPKKVQAAIYELEPVKIRYSRRGGHLESCLIVLFFTTVVLVPFFLWVQPITDMMLAVKLEYCGGNQDFVVSLNQDLVRKKGGVMMHQNAAQS